MQPIFALVILEHTSDVAEHVLELAQTHQEWGWQAHALHLLGDIAPHRDPSAWEQAAVHYQQALALAEELGMRPLVVHCHRSLDTLYAQMSQTEQACAELSTAIELYHAMEMTFWLSETEAAWAQVGGSRGLESDTMRQHVWIGMCT